MKAERKLVGPRISPAAEKFYTENFDSLNQGVEYALDAFPVLARRALSGIKGRFTAAELSLMLDVSNATMLTPGMPGDTLDANVADGMSLDGLDEKWSVVRADLLAKMAYLSPFEAAALEVWARGFWAGDHYEGTGALEKYVENML